MKQITLALLAAASFCTSSFAQTTTRNLYTSGTNLNVNELKTVPAGRTIQLNRTLMAGYNTICLPVDLNAQQLQEAAKDVQIERMAAIKAENGTLNMYFIDCTKEGLQAGVPYLIFSPTTQTMRVKGAEMLNVDTELKSVTMRDEIGNQVTFGSSWDALKVEGRYGIPAQQDAYILESILIRTDGDKLFLPTRCGFTWDAQSAGVSNIEIKHVASLSGMETSIEKLEAQGTLVDVYSTQGTLVKKQVSISEARTALPTGIYVVGGQKVAIK